MIRYPKKTIMKRQLISATILLFSISIFAQPSDFSRVYHTYKGQQGVEAIWVPGFLMKFAGACAGLDQEEKELLRCLRSVTVLTIEEPHLYPGVNFTEEVDLSHLNGNYNLLLEVHDGDDDVVIAAREKRGKITDLIIVVGGEENVLVHLRGRMDSDLLENLGKVSGVEELNFTARI
jgi:hypothetical protein